MAQDQNNKVNIALARVGMVKDTHPSQLDETQYTHAFNANIENEGGNSLNITNEKSNVLASKFKPGFVVIGFENDILSNDTFFFLVNPTTGVGEFGFIENNQNITDLQDLTYQCNSECDSIRELAMPLEDFYKIQPQVPLQTYVTLLSDEYALDTDTNTCYSRSNPIYTEKKLGFNFDVNHPIKKIVIKNEKTGKNIYFTDNYNPPRHIDITNIPDYYVQNVACLDDLITTCIDFNELRVFKLFKIPRIEASSIELGGRLPMGTYEFLIAYADASGQVISPYYSVTQPISIFDQNNKVLEQKELADLTNYAIKLQVTGLDKRYTHYKVAVIQTTDIEGAERYFEEGLHTVHDSTVLYTTHQNKLTTTALDIIRDRIHIERTEGLTAANNILFQYGLTIKKEINLQPVVNFMGQFLKWQTVIAKEDLYDDGVLGSKFKGWNRDEVVPFSIRFLLDGGYETPLFPFIGRTPTLQDPKNPDNAYDFEQVVTSGQAKDPDNKDIVSILSNKTSCGSTDRIYRWQYYNTAIEDEEPCDIGGNSTIDTQEVFEEVTRICELPIPQPIPADTLSITLTDSFSTTENYIEDNIDQCLPGGDPSLLLGTTSNTNICSYLLDTYPSLTCVESEVMGDLNYANPTIECSVEVSKVIGEKIEKIPKNFPGQYSRVVAPKSCSLYKLDITNDNTPLQDSNNPLGYFGSNAVKVYRRDSEFENEECDYPKEIPTNDKPLENNGEGSFNNYYVSDTLNPLLGTKDTAPNSGLGFYNKLHKNALWFKGTTDNYNEFIVDISKQKNTDSDEINIGNKTDLRISIFKKCNSTSPVFSQIIDAAKGASYRFKKSVGNIEITDTIGTVHNTTTPWFTGGEYYIVVDSPIKTKQIDTNPAVLGVNLKTVFVNSPTDGCYTVTKRNIQYERVDISWTGIELKKVCTYKAICKFEQPIAQSCKAYPFRKGKFAYWESTEGYPDNTELYDSTKLKISKDRIEGTVQNPTNLNFATIQEFKEVFTNGIVDNNYTFKAEPWEGAVKKVADFTCRKIRHFKFPDNNIAPFVYDKQQSRFGQTVIFPIGVTIDENIINTFLDVAVDNNLLSAEDRSKITSYEIFSGDTTLDRSIVASGLLYDMRKYREDPNVDKDVLYSNYPYNTYSIDKLNRPFGDGIETDDDRKNLGKGASFGESNRNYTFHSPETEFSKVGLPSEISIQSYMYGNSRGYVDQVKDHPKWVILSERAYALADTLATIEVIVEIAIDAAQALSNAQIWFLGGFSSGFSIGGPAFAASIIITGFGAVASSYFRYGRYRYQWLKIFRDLGTPHNFAYYYFSDGYYNYVNQSSLESSGKWRDEGDKLRSLNVAKYMKDGRYIITNEVTGEKLNVNNIDREYSVLLSFGDNPITYPPTYTSYDKNLNDSSLTYLGENNIKTSGRSRELVRNIASPYAALKNYNPSQYGTIGSIKWLSTGHRGDLKNPQDSCLSIFGGDTFITRHTLKRKLSLFLVTAMKQANMTPYNYYFYSNIGRRPNFYVSYEENKNFENGGKLFPEIRSDYSMDTLTGSGNYITPPSKFYLYYYGVPSFLTETRINTAYRYAGKSQKENFYPLVGDLGEWTQENVVSIREPNVYKYNSTYSKRTFPELRHRVIPDTYRKVFADKAQDKPNGILASLPDSNETGLSDSWLIYRPQDTFEFPTNYGKLRDIIDVESQAILTRFSDTSILYNKVDNKIDVGAEVTAITMGGKSFFQRLSTSFVNSKLGYGGTQNFTQVSCEAGHFWADAKRGQVLMVAPNSGAIQEISTSAGSKASGMRNWFKEHLPFKILKTLPNVDTDNPYNGVGLTMGWDSRHRRVLLTKKDYLPKPCVEFIEGRGFVYNNTKCCDEETTTNCPSGFSYNETTSLCEKYTDEVLETVAPSCSPISCPDGYTYDDEEDICVSQYVTDNLCPEDSVYNSIANTCTEIEESPADCVCAADVFATPQSLCNGGTTSIALTSTIPGVTYQWVVAQTGVTGASSGAGSTIAQTLYTTTGGTAVYTITPYEAGGCVGQSIQVTATVSTIPNIIATPNTPQTIDSESSISIALSSGAVGTTFAWTVTAPSTITGATAGSGNTITNTLTATVTGVVVYHITATTPNGCINTLEYQVNVSAVGIALDPFDYMIITYTYNNAGSDANGRDLDSATAFQNTGTSEDNKFIGCGQPSIYATPTSATPINNAYLFQAGDDVGNGQGESIVVNFKNLELANISVNNNVKVELYAGWCDPSIGYIANISATTYLGGTLTKTPGLNTITSTGAVVDTFLSPNKVIVMGCCGINPLTSKTHIGTIYYNLVTKVSSVIFY